MKKVFLIVLIVFLFLGNKVVANPVTNRIDNFIIQQIDSAQSTIDVCVFIFEWQPIADALVRANNRGIKVNLITDERSLHKPLLGGDSNINTLEYISGKGIDSTFVWIGDNAIMHNKFVIIDNSKLLLGSYNFQEAATLRNKENFVLLNDTSIINSYKNIFNEIKKESVVFQKELIPQETETDYIGIFKRISALLSFLLNVFLIVLLYKKNRK